MISAGTDEIQAYLDRSVTLNPILIKELGILRNRCMIQTDHHKLACVPYTLSLKDCKVLLILSPKEQKIIHAAKESDLLLHLEFLLPDEKKIIPMFVRIRIRDFRELNSSRNQCLLTAGFRSIPRDYKELLVRYFQKQELYERVFQSARFNSRAFCCREIRRGGLMKQAVLRREEGGRLTGRIIELSLNRAALYVDTEEEILRSLPGDVLLEMQQREVPFSINATLKGYTPSQEVEGFFILQLALNFSTSLTNCLYPLLARENKDGSGIDRSA